MTRIASARFDNSPMNYFMKCFFWFNCMHRLITPVHPGSPALARVASAVPIGWNVGWCSATRSDNLPPLAGWALQHKLQRVRSWVITTWVSPMLHLHLHDSGFRLESRPRMVYHIWPKTENLTATWIWNPSMWIRRPLSGDPPSSPGDSPHELWGSPFSQNTSK